LPSSPTALCCTFSPWVGCAFRLAYAVPGDQSLAQVSRNGRVQRVGHPAQGHVHSAQGGQRLRHQLWQRPYGPLSSLVRSLITCVILNSLPLGRARVISRLPRTQSTLPIIPTRASATWTLTTARCCPLPRSLGSPRPPRLSSLSLSPYRSGAVRDVSCCATWLWANLWCASQRASTSPCRRYSSPLMHA
jgi:hypothetical protein